MDLEKEGNGTGLGAPTGDHRPGGENVVQGDGGGAENARLQPRLIPLVPSKIPEVRAARGRGRIPGTCRCRLRPRPAPPRRSGSAPAGHGEAGDALGSRFLLNSHGAGGGTAAGLSRPVFEERPYLKKVEEAVPTRKLQAEV